MDEGETQILRSAKDDNKKNKDGKKTSRNKTVSHHIVGSFAGAAGAGAWARCGVSADRRNAAAQCEDEAEDRAMEADLRADEKEVAEHIMLVDLGRNDVGRVSEFGSVKREGPDVCRTIQPCDAPGQLASKAS